MNATVTKLLALLMPILLIAAALQGRWDWTWHGSGFVAWLLLAATLVPERS